MNIAHLRAIDCRTAGTFAWYALVFLQPFQQFGALRILSMAVLLICLAREFSLRRPTLSNVLSLRIAAAIGIWSIIVSLLGPYPIDSAHSLRKDLLVQALMLVGAFTYVQTVSDAWRIIGVALAGFGVVTGLSLIEIGQYWATNGFSLWIQRSHSSFWGGYASTGAFYIPLLTGWLIAAPKNLRWSIVGTMTLAAAILLVILYGSRTPLIVIAVSILILLALLKRWKSIMVTSALALSFMGLIQTMDLGHIKKYESLLKSETYVTNTGLSQRLSVWEGCWDVIAERPLTGYGYGWKKLAWAINDGDYAERWKNRPDITSYYLVEGKASYGKVNPHSYPLQVIFEIGMVGLALVLFFWITIFQKNIALIRRADSRVKSLSICLLTTLIGYVIANLTNGHWVGGLANLSLVFAGCILTLARNSNDESVHSPESTMADSRPKSWPHTMG